jgi:hypothetical protein
LTRLILASLVLAISILPLYAQSSSLHTDRSGYTTGTKTIKQQRDGCTVGMRLTTSRSNSFKGETAARVKT